LQAFISYSFQDKEIKNKLKKTLESNGIKCYDAAHDEDYGSSLPDKLSRAIDSSDILIALLTHNGSTSTSVSGEIAYAKSSGIRIIPLVESGASVPIFLQGTEQIKFTSDTIDEACQRVARFVITKFLKTNNDVSSDNSTEETIVIESGEHQIYPYDLEASEKLTGQIVSDIPVNIYIVNHRNLQLLEDDKEFTAEYFTANVKRCKINFRAPIAGLWNVVIQNEEDDEEEYEDAEVNVFLDVK